MKLYLAIPNFGPGSTVEAMLEIAREAESLGLDGIGTTDHLLVPAGQPHRYERVYDPLTVLGWLAGQTERLQLITSVIVVLMRNPVAVAKEAVTIDQLSGGRLILGLGAGWHEQEFANVHADFSRRGKRLDDVLRLYRHLFSGSREPFESEFYGYEDGVFEPLPVRGDLPILVGGNSDAAVRRAARYADVYESTAIGVEEWSGRTELLRSEAGGRTVESGARIGLAGEPAEMISELQRWREAGAEHVMFSFGFTEGFLGKLRLFGREVLPNLA
ncbi:MAG TPA: TIGR03619 family F420-dependent LLM class oxidoreductase [Candidatus Dormibacteraeota bacterium]